MKSLLLIAFLLYSFSVLGQASSNGLIAYYPFNGNANDESGNSIIRNGTVTGATLAADRFGQPNKSYSFNGTSNYVRVTNWQTLTGNATRTMSMWFKTTMPTNGANSRAMLWWGVDASNTVSWMGRHGNNISFGFFGYNNECIISNAPYFDDKWHHLVLTHDGASKKLWVDGALLNTTSNGSLNTSSTDLYIGSGILSNAAYYFYQGQLDDIRIYNRGLTDVEVLQLYQAEVAPTSAEYAKIGSNRFIHSIGLYNTAIGNMAGNALTASAGTNNAFIGYQTGRDNSTGSFNSFIGYRAGYANTTGNQNTLVGSEVGYALTGSANTMLGYQAGRSTSTGSNNTFIGPKAGFNNTSGSNNIIIGPSSGTNVTTGDDNILMGYNTRTGDGRGRNNIIIGGESGGGLWSGGSNTLIGYRASAESANLENATAIGANARVMVSNALVLGNQANVGIGTSSPLARLHVIGQEENTSGLRFGRLTANSPAMANPTSFLTVDQQGDVILGSVSARSLRLQTASVGQWPDFVFSKAYTLMPLDELSHYVQANRHLPGFPSAQEMTTTGASVEWLITSLVKTQEDQTHYLTQLKAENDQLRYQIEQLHRDNQEIKDLLKQYLSQSKK